jgi:hypothetical protein
MSQLTLNPLDGGSSLLSLDDGKIIISPSVCVWIVIAVKIVVKFI